MAFSQYSKRGAAKFGFAIAVAVSSLPMLTAEAVADGCLVVSDTLQVGPQPAAELCEGAEGTGNSISEFFTFNPTQQSLGTKVIILTEPGSGTISDIVSATVVLSNTSADLPNHSKLTVRLTSDDDINPLLISISHLDLSLAETGAVQDLTGDFQNLFGFNANDNLPTVLVTSDVPEPATLGLFVSGVLGVGALRRHKRKTV